ncbi:hypothetical protein DAQ1742_03124 [Dickeya aquatica]|uniref:Uncharacterized protein n=1 Tax=Dickeya aquatica TaxID=1401087 RepID=A0A375AD14_9GAMM|nr:hypothetical protein DAQ1742_03124 [Dickeya aquatica]
MGFVNYDASITLFTERVCHFFIEEIHFYKNILFFMKNNLLMLNDIGQDTRLSINKTLS